jgi:O-antigen/teichoic acid export membrane protein
MAVAVPVVPALLRGLGVDRFGLLSLAWIAIGYLSLFDLGIGRALTQLTAEKLGRNQEDAIPPLAWTSLLLMFVLGGIGGGFAAAATPWMIHSILKIPSGLQGEALHSFYWVAASVPLVTVTAGFRGMLEAQQHFRLLNLIRIPMSVFSFLGPLVALPFSHSLTMVILVLVGGRLAGLVVHAAACLYVFPALRHCFPINLSLFRPLIELGGWMTVSNIVGPLMVYMDRFLIGSLLSTAQVAYYAAPFDVVTRLSIIPGALSSVLFPAFTVSLLREPARAGLFFRRGLKYLFAAMFPIVLAIIAFAPEGLHLWLGGRFSPAGSTVLRWLAIGVFINAFAYLPFTAIQSSGHPNRTAKLHLAELPLYLIAMFILIKAYGITGAAMAWTARLGIEAMLVFWMVSRTLPQGSRYLWKLLGAASAALLLLYLATLLSRPPAKIAYVVLVLAVFCAAVWRRFTPEERALLRRPISNYRNRIDPVMEAGGRPE